MRIAGLIVMSGLLTADAVAAEIPSTERRSGYSFMTPDTKAMQDDDTANPGMLWVLDGEKLWSRKTGAADKACADCHNDAPHQHEGRRRPLSRLRQGARAPRRSRSSASICAAPIISRRAPLAYESRDLLALTAFVAQQSRGAAIETGSDPQLAPFIAKGRELFMQRQGQLNLGCANCHDDNWDKRLAGSAITQAHPTGYPLYRLEWQSLGSLQRRYAPASPASARRPMITARRNWSSWNCI